jgi:hypothetical protein
MAVFAGLITWGAFREQKISLLSLFKKTFNASTVPVIDRSGARRQDPD